MITIQVMKYSNSIAYKETVYIVMSKPHLKFFLFIDHIKKKFSMQNFSCQYQLQISGKKKPNFEFLFIVCCIAGIFYVTTAISGHANNTEI